VNREAREGTLGYLCKKYVKTVTNTMKEILIKLIELYQHYLSPDHSIWAKSMNKPPYCKHIPTCSDYTKEAIEKK